MTQRTFAIIKAVRAEPRYKDEDPAVFAERFRRVVDKWLACYGPYQGTRQSLRGDPVVPRVHVAVQGDAALLQTVPELYIDDLADIASDLRAELERHHVLACCIVNCADGPLSGNGSDGPSERQMVCGLIDGQGEVWADLHLSDQVTHDEREEEIYVMTDAETRIGNRRTRVHV